MEVESQQATPSTAAEGVTLVSDECKRRVVDSIEAEQSYKFKVDPLMTNTTLETEAMRKRHEINIARR